MVNYGIIIAGQSNAQGTNGPGAAAGDGAFLRNGVADFAPERAPGQPESPDSRIFMYSFGNSGVPLPYTPVTAGQLQIAESPIQCPFTMVEGSTCFAVSFCKMLLPLLKPDDQLTIINTAMGGTSVSRFGNEFVGWHPDGPYSVSNLFENSVASVVQASNQGVVPAVLLWHQGEQDQLVPNPNYASELAYIFAQYRIRLNSPTLPVIVGTMGGEFATGTIANIHSGFPTLDGITISNAALADFSAFSQKTASTGVSDSEVTILTDFTHFSRNGARLMGPGYAREFLKLTSVIDFPQASTVPSAPINVYAQVSDTDPSSSILVYFSPPNSDGGSPVTGYTCIGTPGNLFQTKSSANDGPFVFSNLEVEIAYEFSVTVSNAIGASNPEKTAPISLMMMKPPPASNSTTNLTPLWVILAISAAILSGIGITYAVLTLRQNNRKKQLQRRLLLEKQ